MPTLVLAVSLVTAAFEFARTPSLHTLPWTPTGFKRLQIYFAAVISLSLLRLLSRRMGWRATPNVLTYFIALALLYGVAAVGFGPFAAVTVLCVSSVAVGSLIVADSMAHHPGEMAICLCLGEALLGFAASLMGRSYLCYPVVFLVLMLVPIFLQRRRLASRAMHIWETLRAENDTKANLAAITVLVLVAGIQFLLAMKPEVGTDSLAMHLALPAYVSIHHHWSFDVKDFIWALMPQTTDWSYTLAYMIGGEMAARLLNFANLLVMLALLYSFLRSYCTHVTAIVVCALFAATPLVQNVTGSLFIENLLAALLFACLMAFCLHMQEGGHRLFFTAWLCLGLALSCKSGALAFLPGLIALSITAARKRPVSLRSWFGAVGGFLAIGFYFYAWAWLVTKNPFFPTANEIFQSPLFPTAPISPHFRLPLSWRTLQDITFHSSRYIEGSDGSAGFQFLLLPAAVVAMIWRRHSGIVWSAAIGLTASLLTFSHLSYLRYLYPAMLMLMAPLSLWLDEQRQGGPLQKWLAFGTVALAGTANVLYQPASGWYHRDFVWNQIWDHGAAAEYLVASAPARNIVEVLNRIAPREPAFFCQYDHIAGLAGLAYTTNWHTYHRNGGLLNMREVGDVLQFLNERGIRYVASPFPEDLDTWPRVLPAFLEDFTEPVFASGRWSLYRIKPGFQGSAGVDLARRLAERPPAADPGTYDDADLRIVRRGSGWYRDAGSFEPLYHTQTKSRTAGDELIFGFLGSGITYVFTRDPSSGIAELQIDGKSVAAIDAYASTPVFRQQQTFDGLTPGPHTLTIRVTGRKNTAAQDVTVALDALVVTN